MDIQQYKGTKPNFDLFSYFEGSTKAYGIFQGRNGELKRQFTVDIVGTVKGDRLTLVEDFIYSDGEVSQRIWRIRRTAKGEYVGEADDVIGLAKGESVGSVLHWKYTMQLPYKGTLVSVGFDDWMFLQADGFLINKAEVTKFGFTVGEVTLVFQK